MLANARIAKPKKFHFLTTWWTGEFCGTFVYCFHMAPISFRTGCWLHFVLSAHFAVNPALEGSKEAGSDQRGPKGSSPPHYVLSGTVLSTSHASTTKPGSRALKGVMLALKQGNWDVKGVINTSLINTAGELEKQEITSSVSVYVYAQILWSLHQDALPSLFNKHFSVWWTPRPGFLISKATCSTCIGALPKLWAHSKYTCSFSAYLPSTLRSSYFSHSLVFSGCKRVLSSPTGQDRSTGDLMSIGAIFNQRGVGVSG